MTKTPRRRCKICREWFHPRNFQEWWCSPEHGAVFGIQERDKQRQKALIKAEQQRKVEYQAERQSLKIRKLAVKPLSYFVRQAQHAFNSYIRLRDASDPCISCGRYHDGQYHAGHYRTTGANPELRFDEGNCHKQCAPCNNHLSGNIENYTPRLISKIGLAAFNRLMGPHDAKKYTREELQSITSTYRAQTRALRKSEAA
jgi:Bacteriophage Lambda NinG protein